jgi:hypothetical protein
MDYWGLENANALLRSAGNILYQFPLHPYIFCGSIGGTRRLCFSN